VRKKKSHSKMSRVFLLACVFLQGAVAAPTFKSVLLTAQYNCVDFLCPDWELDLTRVNPTEPPVQDTIILSNLIPKSPVAAMSFPVLTAYDADPRNFYTVTLPSPTSGDIWEHNVDGAVTNATQISHSQFKFPDAFGTVSRVHITGNHTLIALFTTGLVANVNVATGFFIPVGNLSLDDGFKLTQASVVEPTSNVLYAFATEGGKCKLYTHSLVTGQTTSADITLKDIHFELEILFTALWIPTKKAIALFLAGGNEFGLDQIAWVDPATGDAKEMIGNLDQQYMMGFACNTATKDCDLLQTAAYDPISNHIYFQVTQYESNDDPFGQTTIAYVNIDGRFAYVDPSLTFSFGYMGFFVATVNA